MSGSASSEHGAASALSELVVDSLPVLTTVFETAAADSRSCLLSLTDELGGRRQLVIPLTRLMREEVRGTNGPLDDHGFRPSHAGTRYVLARGSAISSPPGSPVGTLS